MQDPLEVADGALQRRHVADRRRVEQVHAGVAAEHLDQVGALGVPVARCPFGVDGDGSVTGAQALGGAGETVTDPKQIGPALDSLKGVNDLLKEQNKNLQDTITYMAPFYRLYANVLGNGRWFESVVTNLLPPALPQQNTTRSM